MTAHTTGKTARNLLESHESVLPSRQTLHNRLGLQASASRPTFRLEQTYSRPRLVNRARRGGRVWRSWRKRIPRGPGYSSESNRLRPAKIVTDKLGVIAWKEDGGWMAELVLEETFRPGRSSLPCGVCFLYKGEAS